MNVDKCYVLNKERKNWMFQVKFILVWLGGIYSFIVDLWNIIFNVIIQKSRVGGLVCIEFWMLVNGFGKISRWYVCDVECRELFDIF